MAFTENEESSLRAMLSAFQNGKRINELDRATGSLSEMLVAVQDGSGETKRLNLSEAVETAGNPLAGRYWNETNATPTAAGYYGSLAALRALPTRLGLGRYLVTDDRVRRKLDPADSTRFDDGSPARLDGSMGQCMWCWNAHYYTTWKEGNNTVEAISFLPIAGKPSVYVPAGGVAWFNAGVLDRTTQTLCAVISTDEKYRGGNGNALADTYDLAADAPQKTMLGMATTATSTHNFGVYARKRGEGWEADWFVARAVVEYTMRIILGTRNVQAAYNAELDENGLMQGGLGAGVTGIPDWNGYNGYYPLIPTSVGLELGDACGVVDYSITKADGTSVYAAPVPVFFGLVNPFGHIWSGVRGVLIDAGAEKTLGYVAPSMYADFDDTKTDGLLFAAELPRDEGYIKRQSMFLLCGFPTEIGATPSTYFSDYFYTNAKTSQGLRVRLAGGSAGSGAGAGASCTHAHFAPTYTGASLSAALCYFEEDPQIGA